MKTSFLYRTLLLATISISIGSYSAHAQFLKKLAHHVKEAAEDGVDQAATNHAVNDAGNATDKAIDKAEGKAGSVVAGDNNSGAADNSSNSSSDNNASATSGNTSAPPSIKTYKSYDFVQGDSVIFESNLTDERVGEIPSQFILSEGQIDVQQEDGQKVIHAPEGSDAV